MAHDDLILDRYEPLGTAGEGGFGTVQIAWDPRIQRKVAIKTIRLTELDAARAALPGAQAVSNPSTADRWHGVMPWNEYLAEEGATTGAAFPHGQDDWPEDAHDQGGYPDEDYLSDGVAQDGTGEGLYGDSRRRGEQITSLAHLPGLDEARTAAMLSDPRIVTVYDFEIRGRTAYLIMEYIEGITLTQLLADYPDYLTLDMVAAIFDSVAGALSEAHDAGVLHLDIKPDNILINKQGSVKVTDFGLATLADASGVGTTGGGTIGYMPLEQMRREHLDARTDEWSLAAVVYEMLTGDNPFRASSLEEAERAIEEAELVLPSLCWENLDEQIDDVVFYALDPDREERYASVRGFAEEMDKFLGDPERGADQLELVVADALGFDDQQEGFEEEDGQYADERHGAVSARPTRAGVLDRLHFLFGGARGRRASDVDVDEGADEGDYDEDWYDYPEPDERGSRRKADGAKRASRASGGSLLDRMPQPVLSIAPRAFSAVASGFVAFLALANMQILSVGFGPGTGYVIGLIAVIVAACGAFRAHVGALVAFSLFGIALVLCGHPIAGAILLVATVAWWYTVGHVGQASANAALLLPLVGAIGGSSAVPLFAGATLKPLQALATTVYAVVLGLAFGSLGTTSLLGWDGFAFWQFAGADVTGNAMRMVTQFATWTTAAGWVLAAVALAAIRARGSRWLTIAGIAVAVALVLVGSLVFAPPSPQLIVSVALAAAVLLVVSE